METRALTEAIRERLSILTDLEPASIADDQPFAEMGVDSLMLLELVAIVEQWVGHEVPERDFAQLTSIGRVRHYLSAIAEVA